MKLLLDSLVLVHIANDPDKIPVLAKSAIKNGNNEVFLSIASPLELQIKVNLGKIAFSKPVCEIVQQEVEAGNVTLLQITLDHIDKLRELPAHHRDPFDRLLVAQAICEKLTIVTSDELITQYSAPVLWD